MQTMPTEEGKWYAVDEDNQVAAGPYDDEGQALAWINRKAATGGRSAHRAFLEVAPSRVIKIKASALTPSHQLAFTGNDGRRYAVPLYDLAVNSQAVSYRCNWDVSGLISAFLDADIEVVRT